MCNSHHTLGKIKDHSLIYSADQAAATEVAVSGNDGMKAAPEQQSAAGGEKSYNLAKSAKLIVKAVKKGILETAEQLTEPGDMYLVSILVQALYKEGYTSLAKKRLAPLRSKLLSPAPPLLELAFIWAEINYDDGDYSEAAPIFEKLASRNPDMAAARYGAASCYLHEAMNNLLKRVELYHPPEEEKLKIDRYLNDIAEALRLIQDTGWHTEWSSRQSRNFPERPAPILH